MKKLTIAALFVLLLALPSRAHAWGCGTLPYRVDLGANAHFRVNQYAGGLCGPWYLYWPLEAHFQVPAPTGYPYWPNPMGLPLQAPGGSYFDAPGHLPAVPSTPLQPGGFGH
jgi:hypothetical protein